MFARELLYLDQVQYHETLKQSPSRADMDPSVVACLAGGLSEFQRLIRHKVRYLKAPHLIFVLYSNLLGVSYAPTGRTITRIEP